MVIALLLSSLFCNRPSQNEVRIFIKTFGLLLILLSSYNKLAALGAVMFLTAISISHPRDERHKMKEKVSVTHILCTYSWPLEWSEKRVKSFYSIVRCASTSLIILWLIHVNFGCISFSVIMKVFVIF